MTLNPIKYHYQKAKPVCVLTFFHLGLAVDRLSRIFVADTGNHRIQVFDETGRFLFAFGRKGTGPGEFNEPCDVTISRTGHVIVADRLNDRFQLFTPDGKFLRELRCGTLRPIAVTTDQYNNIVTIDSDRSRVLVLTMAGERYGHRILTLFTRSIFFL